MCGWLCIKDNCKARARTLRPKGGVPAHPVNVIKSNFCPCVYVWVSMCVCVNKRQTTRQDGKCKTTENNDTKWLQQATQRRGVGKAKVGGGGRKEKGGGRKRGEQ